MKSDYTFLEGAFALTLLASMAMCIYLRETTAVAVYLSAIHIGGLIVARIPRKKE